MLLLLQLLALLLLLLLVFFALLLQLLLLFLALLLQLLRANIRRPLDSEEEIQQRLVGLLQFCSKQIIQVEFWILWLLQFSSK